MIYNWLFVHFDTGANISWKSTLRSTVGPSTTKAGYMAITQAMKEAIWLHGLLKDLGAGQKQLDVYSES